MSQSKERHEAERWLATAEEDLIAAKALEHVSLYAHACFLSQQCGEKAVKAIWFALGHDPWGHSIQKLIAQFPEPARIPNLQDYIQRAAVLDKFYIPTRYPNGLPDLTPGQSYFASDAEQAIEQAALFVELARRFLAAE